jgi:hypothetical protein
MAQVAPEPTQAPMAMPTLQDRLSQAASPSPMQSYQDWQQQNPNLQEKPTSGIMKALQIAAGIIGGGVPGGVSAGQAIHQHDLPAGLQGVDQQRYQDAVVNPYKTQQGIADTQAQMAQRQSLANKADAQAEEYTPQLVTPEQATALGMPQLAGVTMNARDLATLSGRHDTNTTAIANTGTRAGAAENVATTRANATTNVATIKGNVTKDVADAANKTKLLLGNQRANVSTANSERAHGGAAGGTHKVPADVTKRAALASNVNENAAAAEAVIQRRPDLFGAAGGRLSSIEDMMGSNDPDIAEMGTRMNNVALASNGAHGLRSAEAIQKTKDELFNNFKRGPQGITSALNATRSSVQTFLDDEKNFQQTGQRVPPAGSGTPSANGGFTKTATGPNGHKIGLKGGQWVDVQTGKAL